MNKNHFILLWTLFTKKMGVIYQRIFLICTIISILVNLFEKQCKFWDIFQSWKLRDLFHNCTKKSPNLFSCFFVIWHFFNTNCGKTRKLVKMTKSSYRIVFHFVFYISFMTQTSFYIYELNIYWSITLSITFS